MKRTGRFINYISRDILQLILLVSPDYEDKLHAHLRNSGTGLGKYMYPACEPPHRQSSNSFFRAVEEAKKKTGVDRCQHM